MKDRRNGIDAEFEDNYSTETVDTSKTSVRMWLVEKLVAGEERALARKEAKQAKREAEEADEDAKKRSKKLARTAVIAGGVILGAIGLEIYNACKKLDKNVIDVTDCDYELEVLKELEEETEAAEEEVEMAPSEE